MIAKNILIQLPEMARCLHFAMNNHRVQDINWVNNFVRDFPSHDLRQWDTTMPVLSACSFLKVWFKDHMPNSIFRDFIKKTIQEKVRGLIKASDTIGDYHPFQGVIADTILALNHAMALIDALESGHLINWHTLEIETEISF